MNWRKIQLGDAIHVKHGFAFKGDLFSNTGAYVVLTPGNFKEEGGFRLRPRKDRFYAGDIPEDYILEKGDLMIAMTEQGPGLLGSSALIPEDGKYFNNQRLGMILSKTNRSSINISCITCSIQDLSEAKLAGVPRERRSGILRPNVFIALKLPCRVVSLSKGASPPFFPRTIT